MDLKLRFVSTRLSAAFSLAALAVLSGATTLHAGPLGTGGYAGDPAYESMGGKAAVAVTETDLWDHVPWGATLSTSFNDDYYQAGIELLAPLWTDPDGNTLLFLAPEFGAYDEGRQSYSVGLGLRHLLENADMLVGANVFYDHTETGFDNGYDQLGLGAEIKTTWVDAFFNYYNPEDDQEIVNTETLTSSSQSRSSSTLWSAPFARGNSILQNRTTRTVTTSRFSTRTYNQFEAALEGWDAEAGVLLPWIDKLADVRVYAGAFSYDNPFGEDIEGFKARAEVRLTDNVTLDVAYFDDKRLVEGHWLGGVRVHVPLGKTESPLFVRSTGGSSYQRPLTSFSGAPRTTMRERMAENVQRYPRVVTTVSDPIEDPSKRVERFSRDVDSRTVTETKLPDVIFVNNDGPTGTGVAAGNKGGSGAAEDPEASIQAGADIAATNFDNTGRVWNVFVQGGGPLYVEDVVADRGTRFWGKVPVMGGRIFGGSVKPELEGSFDFDTVPVAQVTGFSIDAAGNAISILDVDEVVITHNMIEASGGDGVYFEYDSSFATAPPEVKTANITIANNMIMNSSNGVGSELEDAEFVMLNIGVHGNQFLNNSGSGVVIDVEDMDLDTDGATLDIVLNVTGNLFEGNDIGLEINEVDTDTDSADFRHTLMAWVAGNTFLNQSNEGVAVDIDSDSDVDGTGTRFDLFFTSNSFQGGSDGLRIDINDFDVDDEMPIVNIQVTGNSFLMVSDDAVDIGASANTFTSFSANVSNNTINGTGGDGIAFDFSDNDVAPGSPNAVIVIGNNFLSNIGDDAVDFALSGDRVDFDLTLGGNQADTVTNTGFLIDGDNMLNLFPAGNNTVTNFGTEQDITNIQSGQVLINGTPRP